MLKYGRIRFFLGAVIVSYLLGSSESANSEMIMRAETVNPEAVLIEDFSTSVSGQFPKNWGWLDGTKVKKISEAVPGAVPYVVMEENGNKYLHADDQGQAITIVAEKKWNVKKYPCITWRWRVSQFPTGANEYEKGKTDNAASLYITFYVNFVGMPRSIKFIWSNSLPVCETFKKEGTGKATNTVIESGTARTGVWVKESINIYEHYKAVFGEYPPDEIAGIAIKTDADGTNSRSIADYDDILAVSECEGKCN